MSTDDTIYALATPTGGAIAVIRASGSNVAQAAKSLTGRSLIGTPRYMARVYIKHGGQTLDDAMACCFAAPRSYTGEDMLELYCHGSQAVLRAVCGALMELGMRPAEPGELTRRAFLNGKMDLTQAEAVMDLIQAEAAFSARAALEQMQGRLRREVDGVEALLYDVLSAVNACIDYPEELEDDVYFALPQTLDAAQSALTGLIDEGMRGRVLRDGYRVVLLGAPNAGKSSLLNAMLGFERAIVTKEPGATRDVLEETLPIDGVPVRIMDTAGLREAVDEAEQQGVRRAREALGNADAVLLLLDGAVEATQETRALLKQVEGRNALLVRTKADLPMRWGFADIPSDLPHLDISVKTGEGLPALRNWIKGCAGALGDVIVTNQRHIRALKDARISVMQAKDAFDADSIATDIRDALMCLGSITGRAVDDEVIDQIFARFCVGK